MTKQQLKEYSDAEFENIDTVLYQLKALLKPEAGYSIAELAAVATFIHNFYNGAENILKRIFSYRRIELRDTPTWHKDILKAAADIGIISDDLYNALSNYLSFRHFFVHSYSFTLRWEELKPLVSDIEKTLENFKKATYIFIGSLD
ncbi:MAG: hypothetical protein HZB61_03295 [Nitrospirae bacterium]|nr:hypothetical protein [Nitrospirota bacterium]